MGHLDDHVALVTGGGSGIGAATAERLAREGATVAVNGRSEEGLRDVVQKLEGMGARVLPVAADVSKPDEVEAMVRRVVDELGDLRILVNNAGIEEGAPALEMSLDTWRKQMSVNLDGAFLVAQAAARHMADKGRGVVVNVTSVHEHRPRPGFSAYAVSKAGLGMLTQVLAHEWAEHGIRVLSVAPGAIDTPIQGEQSEQEQREQREAIPAGRVGRPEEVAALIAFLCSEEMAYVTGASLAIDGALAQQVPKS
jgi:NAD(P)-dependent dehydrogenase (short-subunit alcohol dehydrogenase family)